MSGWWVVVSNGLFDSDNCSMLTTILVLSCSFMKSKLVSSCPLRPFLWHLDLYSRDLRVTLEFPHDFLLERGPLRLGHAIQLDRFV